MYIAYLVKEMMTSVNSIYNNLNIMRLNEYEDNIYLEEAFCSAEYLLKLVSGAFAALNKDEEGEGIVYKSHKRLQVRTFGEFDIFIDGELIEFTNHKAKELFAICIDNCGGEVSMKTVIDILWEDRDYDEKVKRLYRKAVVYLNTLFDEHGLNEVFTNGRGRCHINRHKINCDYYEVLDGKNIKDTLFNGKYMSNYSWGEETCGTLCRMASVQLYE
ncbi:MAG: hypothetical protein NC433_11480 [Clostridiales bacterium]|nr:hypothetical protein [Clostridiales bacterium]